METISAPCNIHHGEPLPALAKLAFSGTFQPKEEEERERVSGGECPAKSLMGYRVVPLGKWSQGALLGTSRGLLPLQHLKDFPILSNWTMQ